MRIKPLLTVRWMPQQNDYCWIISALTLWIKASLILSASSFAESDGTLINHEGRAQRFFQCMSHPSTTNPIIMHEALALADCPVQ